MLFISPQQQLGDALVTIVCDFVTMFVAFSKITGKWL